MNKQNQNTNQKTVIPTVRYHPSIQTQAPGARPRTRTSPAQRTGAAAVQPPQAGSRPAVTPRPDGGQKQEQSAQKPVNTPGPDSDRGPPTPADVPPGLEDPMDGRVVEEVEVLTRGQRTNPKWFAWRKNRITASIAHDITHSRFTTGRSQIPPTSYLDTITGERRGFKTRALSWGIEKEAEAVRRYQRMKSAALGRPVTVQDCGLFIDAQRPWLAASPDGIVIDSRSGKRLLCLEVKCPYKHRHRRVEDACRDDPHFCLEIQEEDGRRPGQPPVYRLKTSHSYYTQIQVQLAVTGLQHADLAVFTLKEMAIVPVAFDPDLWEDTVSKLELFYRNAVLPHLRQKTRRDVAAAWMPEP